MGRRRHDTLSRTDLGRLNIAHMQTAGLLRALTLAYGVVRRVISGAVNLLPRKRWRVEDTAAEVDEVPGQIPRRRAYLVRTSTQVKWLVFDCPCGAGHRVILNLDQTRYPHWHLVLSRGKSITLSPSVDFRDEDQRCHYVVRRGRIQWADRRERSIDGIG